MFEQQLDVYFEKQQYADLFSLFAAKVSGNLDMANQWRFNMIKTHTIEEKVAHEDEFEDGELVIESASQLQDFCNEILDTLPVSKAMLFPTATDAVERCQMAINEGKSKFDVSIKIAHDASTLFSLLFARQIIEKTIDNQLMIEYSDLDYSEYIDAIAEAVKEIASSVSLDHIGGEVQLDFEYIDIYMTIK